MSAALPATVLRLTNSPVADQGEQEGTGEQEGNVDDGVRQHKWQLSVLRSASKHAVLTKTIPAFSNKDGALFDDCGSAPLQGCTHKLGYRRHSGS